MPDRDLDDHIRGALKILVPINPEALRRQQDQVRNAVIQDFMYSGGLEKIGFVAGVGAVAADHPRMLPGGVPYHTDGGRAVLFFGTRPRTFAEVKILEWESIVPDREPEVVQESNDEAR